MPEPAVIMSSLGMSTPRGIAVSRRSMSVERAFKEKNWGRSEITHINCQNTRIAIRVLAEYQEAEKFKVRLRLNPLYSYAAQNWGHQAKFSSIEGENLILGLLKSTAKTSACSQALLYNPYQDSMEINMAGLHLVAYFGLCKSTFILLKVLHNVNPIDRRHRTPLSYAVMKGHEAMVKLLLKRNTDIKINAVGSIDVDVVSIKSGRTHLAIPGSKSSTIIVFISLNLNTRANMRFSFVSVGLALTLALCAVVEGQNNQVDVHALVDKNVLMDPAGFQHIGSDGVLRYFNGAGKVIDYVRLTREQLLADVAAFSLPLQEKLRLAQLWDGTDASQVSAKQIWQPSKDVLPLRFADPEAFKREVEKRNQKLAKTLASAGNVIRDVPDHCSEYECIDAEDCWHHGCLGCKSFTWHLGKCY
ncbi:hypothetical protein EMCG_07476 [[Emmonsia] crescens]|uniref:Uncharacterized protein n=1 Tax=[Emmonsia] crescens TaxID=73230 RepID=A0A0G2I9C8_9EURO|nr:hypothetical protein EMCG_07476 [Emmonsia crescens UAMH 3008]